MGIKQTSNDKETNRTSQMSSGLKYWVYETLKLYSDSISMSITVTTNADVLMAQRSSTLFQVLMSYLSNDSLLPPRTYPIIISLI